MKKVKGLLATMLILTMMVGTIGWMETAQGNSDDRITYAGEIKLLDDGNPVRF